MIETVVLGHLSTLLNVPVYMEVPKDHPESYVLIEKTGSGTRNHIHSATFAVQSIAGTLYGAAQLNEAAKSAMIDLNGLYSIGRAALNSDYNFTDPQKKEYRYQAVFDLVYYEEV